MTTAPPAKLWVLLKSHDSAVVNQAVLVSTQDCRYVTHFIKAVKKELSNELGNVDPNRITLHLTQDGPVLRPDFLLSAILSQPGFTNDYETPLVVTVPTPAAARSGPLRNSRNFVCFGYSPNQRKVDCLIQKAKKYLFRTDVWGCVTVIKKRKALTFAHGHHRTLQPGNTIKIYSTEGNVEYDVTVANINAESDWVLLECGDDLCEKEPIWGPVIDGHRYVQLGLSAPHQQESPFAISIGVISSGRVNVYGHSLGSAGANPGDSGGGCFDLSSGYLIGINVGCENLPISLEKDTGAQMYEKISSRYAARAHIIPVISLQYVK